MHKCGYVEKKWHVCHPLFVAGNSQGNQDDRIIRRDRIIAILDYAQSHSDLYGDDDALDQTIRSLHSQINGMLLYQWSLGDDIVTVGEESRKWFRNHRDQADLCDLVLVARYYSLLGTPSEKALPALSKMPAFLKLQLEFSAEESESFIEESKAEVAAVESMLGSV